MGKIAVASGRSVLRIFALAVCALPMYGQTANTGAIAGTVSDPTGVLATPTTTRRQCAHPAWAPTPSVPPPCTVRLAVKESVLWPCRKTTGNSPPPPRESSNWQASPSSPASLLCSSSNWMLPKSRSVAYTTVGRSSVRKRQAPAPSNGKRYSRTSHRSANHRRPAARRSQFYRNSRPNRRNKHECRGRNSTGGRKPGDPRQWFA